MATRVARCPNCDTAFSVVADQLRVRGGWVRCGVCRHVFQVDEGPAPAAIPTPPPVVAPPAATQHTRPAAPRQPEPSASIFPDSDRPQRSYRTEPRMSAPQSGMFASEQPSQGRHTPVARDITAESAHRDAWFADAAEAEDDDLNADDYPSASESRDDYGGYRSTGGLAFLRPDSGAAAYLRVVWTVGFVIAVLVLLGQALWWWRTPIATYMPASRPLLESACGLMGCTVGYVRDPERLTIESSSVQPVVVPGQGPGNRLALTALVRNRSAYPQPWPALELSLTDFSDTVVIRRVLQPSEYLAPNIAGQAFAAQSEQNITVEFTTEGVPVSGYRIALFFP